MDRFVALTRGINVGGRNALPMNEVVEVFEGLGSRNVSTYIQSENVVFHGSSSAIRLGEEISAEIARRRGFAPHVLILTRTEFERAIENNPFPHGDSDPKAVHLGFLDSVPPNPDLDGLEELRVPSERFELIGRVFYLLAPGGVGRSKLAAKSERLLGVSMTDRNWKTVCRIVSMLRDDDAATGDHDREPNDSR